MSAPIGGDDAPAALDEVVRAWHHQWHQSGFVAELEHAPHPDDKGHYHWMIRVRGEEKDVIALWLTLRQRTVHFETELMPAPEENLEALYKFLMVKNAELRGVHLAIGPEEGIYLVGELALGDVTLERLDEMVGATVHYADEIFPTAMALGLASLYRRRPRR
ncbi:MAG: YbjN domain-containing protein [Acidobacteria bacterium]|nr:YbjN domain-containing protein [Acidobacteriota bacterium]